MSLNRTEPLVNIGRFSAGEAAPSMTSYGLLCPGMWVKLLERPHPLSHDEAMLLCADAEEMWSVWIPDHGEARLSPDQFYRLS